MSARRSLLGALAPYAQLAEKAFAREATYRIEAFSNVGSVVLRVYLFRQLWSALYAHNAAPRGIPLHAMLTYATVALLISLVLEVDGTRLLQTKLRDGSIVTDFMKPLNLPAFFFSDGLGQTLFSAVAIVPALALSLLLVRIDVPSPATLLAFALSFALGYTVNFLINFLMNAVAFWTLEIHAIQLMLRWASDLLSGQLVPLVFFPGLLGRIVEALPFAAIYSDPLRIYIGDLPPERWAATFAVQAAWIGLFALLAAVVWQRGARRVVIQGG
ncbi:MAG: ABC transporter permease [Vulcanimicrobiaceae bacterium]